MGKKGEEKGAVEGRGEEERLKGGEEDGREASCRGRERRSQASGQAALGSQAAQFRAVLHPALPSEVQCMGQSPESWQPRGPSPLTPPQCSNWFLPG